MKQVVAIYFDIHVTKINMIYTYLFLSLLMDGRFLQKKEKKYSSFHFILAKHLYYGVQRVTSLCSNHKISHALQDILMQKIRSNNKTKVYWWTRVCDRRQSARYLQKKEQKHEPIRFEFFKKLNWRLGQLRVLFLLVQRDTVRPNPSRDVPDHRG